MSYSIFVLSNVDSNHQKNLFKLSNSLMNEKDNKECILFLSYIFR